MIDIKNIKKDFPIFTNNKDLVYLDTVASSQTPEVVLEKVKDYYTEFRANIHRGLYDISERATLEYEQVRDIVALFIGGNKDEIIFTHGATESSNMLVYMLENELILNEGDEIVTSIMEHHASLTPLQELAKRKKLVLKFIPLLDDNGLDMEKAEKLITEKTKIVSVLMASNVLGTVNDIETVTKLAHKVDAFMITDATAAVGHKDVKVLDVDALYFSGHKMCGPTGVGVLYLKNEYVEKFNPSFFGGGIVDKVTKEKTEFVSDVRKFEPGTPNISGVIGLGEAVSYLQNIGLIEIQKHSAELVKYAIQCLKAEDWIDVYTQEGNMKNIGTVAFAIKGVHPHDVVEILNRFNVAARAGHHCAQPLHTELGVPTTVRASFYLYNTKEDIDALLHGLKEVKKVFA